MISTSSVIRRGKRMSINPKTIIVSNYLVRNLPKSVRKTVFSYVYRSDLIGMSVAEVMSIIIESGSNRGVLNDRRDAKEAANEFYMAVVNRIAEVNTNE